MERGLHLQCFSASCPTDFGRHRGSQGRRIYFIAQLFLSVDGKSIPGSAIAVTFTVIIICVHFYGCSFAGTVMIVASCQLHIRELLVFSIACVEVPEIERLGNEDCPQRSCSSSAVQGWQGAIRFEMQFALVAIPITLSLIFQLEPCFISKTAG